MNIRYRVELNEAERDELTAMLKGGTQAARKLKRAQILLAADGGSSDAAIADGIGVGQTTVYRIRRRFVAGNLAAALTEEPRPGAARKLTGREEALLVATACATPPEGRARWTLELLADEMEPLAKLWRGSARFVASGDAASAILGDCSGSAWYSAASERFWVTSGKPMATLPRNGGKALMSCLDANALR